jgi:hypothetical protein
MIWSARPITESIRRVRLKDKVALIVGGAGETGTVDTRAQPISMVVLETRLERDITRRSFQDWISRTVVPRQ